MSVSSFLVLPDGHKKRIGVILINSRQAGKEDRIDMNKLPIKKVVEGLLKLQDTGESATLLGIGPMSPNLLQASFEIARDYDFPLMFIASRNQVDADELGGIRSAFARISVRLRIR